MSHFSTVKTSVKNISTLKEAAKKLGLEIQENTTCRGFSGATKKCDLVIRGKNGYDIGFQKAKDGGYQIVADWWGVRMNQDLMKIVGDERCSKLIQEYSGTMVKQELTSQGFYTQSCTKQKDGVVRMVFQGGW